MVVYRFFSEWCDTYNPGLAIVIRQGPLAAIWWIIMLWAKEATSVSVQPQQPSLILSPIFLPSTVVVDINVHLGLDSLASREHRANTLERRRVLADGV